MISHRIKVDYVVGQLLNKTVGLDRYMYELLSRLTASVQAKVIGFKIPLYLAHVPYSARAYCFVVERFLYPYRIRKRVGIDSIIHVRSQDDARFLAGWIPKGRLIINCLDLVGLELPEYHSTMGKVEERGVSTIKNADAIITVSEYSKQRIIHNLQIHASKIHIIFPGVDRDIFKPIAPTDVHYDYFGLDANLKYILCLGTDEPRKNISLAIRAFSEIHNKIRGLKLLIAGNGYWNRWKTEKSLAKMLKIEDEIRFLEYVDDSMLPVLYNIADLFVFPSLYEGFGLPPLEAMACGTPVIASNRTSIPEVVGSAGILFDPSNLSRITNAMEQILTNPKLSNELTSSGLLRSTLFSWDESALKLNTLYSNFSS